MRSQCSQSLSLIRKKNFLFLVILFSSFYFLGSQSASAFGFRMWERDSSSDLNIVSSALTEEGQYLYVGGYEINSSGIPIIGRVERRFKTNGSLDTSFGTDGIIKLPASDAKANIKDIVVNGDYIYVGALGNNNYCWTITKLNIITGTTVSYWYQCKTVGSSDVHFSELRLDPNSPISVYISGELWNPTLGRWDGWFVLRWDGTTEKYLNTESGLGVANSASPRVKRINIDNTSVYVIGTQSVSATDPSKWRIEKRNKTTGVLDTLFDGDGIVVSNPSTYTDEPHDIIVQDGHLYIVGSDSGGTNGFLRGRFEKRDATNGSLCANTTCGGAIFGTNGVSVQVNSLNDSYSEYNTLTVSDDGFYIAGNIFTNDGYQQWLLVKQST